MDFFEDWLHASEVLAKELIPARKSKSIGTRATSVALVLLATAKNKRNTLLLFHHTASSASALNIRI